ncbi:hypothetical protein AOQ84DRAFT_419439 [Glonium stellatum]|uniref:Uncharacterized protein n=1 Tax=Glonium stellatum TaxID=574774 RepID=A0A8E2ERG9_9PEZI|nr:hypothetical protein AOQ84DRAFT_419439 [Glonium stellatum]
MGIFDFWLLLDRLLGWAVRRLANSSRCFAHWGGGRGEAERAAALGEDGWQWCWQESLAGGGAAGGAAAGGAATAAAAASACCIAARNDKAKGAVPLPRRRTTGPMQTTGRLPLVSGARRDPKGCKGCEGSSRFGVASPPGRSMQSVEAFDQPCRSAGAWPGQPAVA